MSARAGVSTGSIEASPGYRRKQARKRRAEEGEWTGKNGPVVVRLGEYEIVAESAAKKHVVEARRLLVELISSGLPPPPGGAVRRVLNRT